MLKRIVNMIYCGVNAHNRNRSTYYSRVNHQWKIIKLSNLIHLSSLVWWPLKLNANTSSKSTDRQKIFFVLNAINQLFAEHNTFSNSKSIRLISNNQFYSNGKVISCIWKIIPYHFEILYTNKSIMVSNISLFVSNWEK